MQVARLSDAVKAMMAEWPFYDGKAYCPKCGNANAVVVTPYGFRTCCGECKIRWTRIRGEVDWVAETYSPLEDNRTKDEEDAKG